MFVRTSLMRLPRPDRGSAAPAPVAAAAGMLGATLALVTLGLLLGPLVRFSAQVMEAPTADGVVGLALIAAGAVLAAWYALTGLALLAGTALRRSLGVARWGAPALRRLAAGTAIGAAAAFGSVPALAAPEIPDDLTWGAIAEEAPTSAESGSPSATASTPEPEAVSAPTGPEPTLEDSEGADLNPGEAPAEAGSETEGAPASSPAEPSPSAEPHPEVTQEVGKTLEDSGPASTEPPAVPAAPAAAGLPAAPAAIPPLAQAPAGLPAWAFMLAEESVYVVQPGDCLWTIASTELPGASDSALATRVAEYVSANPSLAANPDLIHPGDLLTLPSPEGALS